MIHLQGKIICGGVVSAAAYLFKKNTDAITDDKPLSSAYELSRLKLAISHVKDEIALCKEQAEGDTAKEIFEIHRMMLEDEDITDSLYNSVCHEGLSAENAVIKTEEYFSQMFLSTNDEYMIARIDDIKDVCGRLTAALSNKKSFNKPHGTCVLVANELLPGDLMNFDKNSIAGIIMGSGSVNSHISILIKEMGIPALICENADKISADTLVLLNADKGEAFVEPDKNTYDEFKQIEKRYEKKSVFSSKKLHCKIYVNIGNPDEVTPELMGKCDGIGLFRTEYLYLGRKDLPDEDEQFAVYKKVLKTANGKPVTVRTFDLGSDKRADALPLKAEENPALGFRGLRVYSLYPDVFKTQIRALLRASVYGNLRIMYPMVISSTETERIKEIILQTADELSKQGIEYKIPLLGAMIETPAAAILSDGLAKTVDFFSIGTNDLTQYVLGIDRQNGELDGFCDTDYKAVMYLIKMTAENAHKNGMETGICGELASDTNLIEKWTEFGIDYLSVTPAAL